LLPLSRDLFVEPSPAPTKWAMKRMGLCGGASRLPIVGLTGDGQLKVEAALKESGLL
jgi:4-hydroxy-tetrahydrodipicolinate synthase